MRSFAIANLPKFRGFAFGTRRRDTVVAAGAGPTDHDRRWSVPLRYRPLGRVK
jgi:hypothetical protein